MSGYRIDTIWKNDGSILSPKINIPIKITGTTNDGTTNIHEGYDSDGTLVYNINTDGDATFSGALTAGSISGASTILLAADGTAAAPAYSWLSETNSGVYKDGPGTIGISVLGVPKIFFNSVGLGVNTADPQAGIHFLIGGVIGDLPTIFAGTSQIVQNTADAFSNTRVSYVAGGSGENIVDFGDTSLVDAGGFKYNHANNYFGWRTNFAYRMYLDNAGNIQMGGSAPTGTLTGGKFQVYCDDDAGASNALNLRNNSGTSVFTVDSVGNTVNGGTLSASGIIYANSDIEVSGELDVTRQLTATDQLVDINLTSDSLGAGAVASGTHINIQGNATNNAGSAVAGLTVNYDANGHTGVVASLFMTGDDGAGIVAGNKKMQLSTVDIGGGGDYNIEFATANAGYILMNTQALKVSGNSTDGSDYVLELENGASADVFTVDTLGNMIVGGNATIQGNLTVNGTTTTIDTTTLLVEDKNIEIGNVTTPTDVTADGGGITLLGDTNKTIVWDNANDNWTSSEHWNLATGKEYKINNASVLSSTTLGSGVVSSSLTSVGTLTSLTMGGNIDLGTNDITNGGAITLSGIITQSNLVRGSSSESVADDGTITLAPGVSGWLRVMAGDNEEAMDVRIATDGTVTIDKQTTNCADTDSDGNLCVYDGGTGAIIKNRLGSTKTIKYIFEGS